MTTAQIVRICTDGCCIENHLKGGGIGGWGATLEFVVDGVVKATKSISGALPQTTNNRAEVQAVIAALQALKWQGVTVDLYTDSQYVAGQLAGARTNTNQDVVGPMRTLAARHTVMVHVVKGHSGHVGNENCDALAKRAARTYAASVSAAA